MPEPATPLSERIHDCTITVEQNSDGSFSVWANHPTGSGAELAAGLREREVADVLASALRDMIKHPAHPHHSH